MAGKVSDETSPSSQVYGRRLIPHMVDDIASKVPDKEAFSIPYSSNPKDGWKAISFKEYANAINRAARRIIETCGTPRAGTFLTIAYLGPNDARYVIMLVAAIKAGYKALFISPRNTQEGQLSLFDNTDCRFLAFAKSQRAIVQPWLQERDTMKAIEVGELDAWFPKQDVEPFPYDKTFEQAEWEHVLVLHTSGSTGIPKAITLTHGLLATVDSYHNMPNLHGNVPWLQGFTGFSKKNLAPMPMFHAAGMYFFISCVIYWNAPVAFGIGDRPLSSDLVIECLANADVEGALLPPTLLEEMSQNEDHIQSLAQLNFVGFGGGNLNRDAGNRLVKNGVTLSNVIGATEYTLLPQYFQSNRDLWQYFIINSDLLGADWRKVEGHDDVYRLVIVRNDKHQGQGVFYTFPDLDEYDTNDMYQPHPTLLDHWIYYGRSDNIIVFSNGEKLNPITIEEIVVDHPQVKGALVVGTNRFQPGLIIEPTTNSKNNQEAKKLLDSVWPYVVNANKETVSHGQIGRQFMIMSTPDKPFLRAAKGTVQRAGTISLYKDEIDKLYEGVGKAFEAAAPRIDISSEENLAESISALFQAGLGAKGELLQEDTDFFAAGVDSLQVINASRLIRCGLEAAGSDATVLETRVIYGNPTPRKLARYLYSFVREEGRLSLESDQRQELQAMGDLWAKYTAHLPTKREGRPNPMEKNQTVIVTGTTGMLGSYCMDLMVKNPAVKKIICLNRAEDGGLKQHAKAVKERGFSPVYASKAEFLNADLSLADFGLPHDVYIRLLENTDRFIHNAWPVNFNMPIESFEPYIRGTRNVADFASISSKRVAVVFISSISTVENWDSNSGAVPEERLEDLTLPMSMSPFALPPKRVLVVQRTQLG